VNSAIGYDVSYLLICVFVMEEERIVCGSIEYLDDDVEYVHTLLRVLQNCRNILIRFLLSIWTWCSWYL